MKLSVFEMAVNANIASGDLDSVLLVKDKEGSYPIVSALGEEPLSLLIERCRAIGGSANVFILDNHHVRYLFTSMSPADDRSENVVDLSDSEQWENGNSEISLFLEFLRQVKRPVRLPGDLPCNLDMRDSNVVLEDYETPIGQSI